MSARKVGRASFCWRSEWAPVAVSEARMGARSDEGVGLLFAGSVAVRAIGCGAEDVCDLAGSVAVFAIGTLGRAGSVAGCAHVACAIVTDAISAVGQSAAAVASHENRCSHSCHLLSKVLRKSLERYWSLCGLWDYIIFRARIQDILLRSTPVKHKLHWLFALSVV